ncbi:GtrA family protein [Terrabacter sp. BE26]|uniref:GtrA family protein n=1 Tax=Terrabacter sp. BE26 TaxID=2898152 RepID=UPI0035BE5F20
MTTSKSSTARRALGFGIIGATGIAVNQLAFWLAVVVGSRFVADPEAGGASDAAQYNMMLTVAAIAATQVSTVWNFVLADRLVYRHRPPGTSRRVAFAKSWAVNNAFNLVLRVPILLALVWLGLNHLWANLVAITVIFVARFYISERWIWHTRTVVADFTDEAATRPTKAEVLVEMNDDPLGPHMAINLKPRRRTKLRRYSIHGLCTILSEVKLPELAEFEVDRLPCKHADITVRRGYVGYRRMSTRVRATMGPGLFVYREHLGSLGANFRVDLDNRTSVTVSPLLARSHHVVYTNVVEALLRFVLVNKGFMLLHSATLQLGNETIMLSAQTDTGKTGTILRLMREHPTIAGFLSDDMTIINGNGVAYSFPKPLTISSHTLRAVDNSVLSVGRRAALALQSRIHSKDGRTFALFLARLNIPIIAINALTQILVPPPKYQIRTLVPTAAYRPSGQVSRIFIIGRGPALTAPLSHDEARRTLMANTEDAYGFPPFSTMEQAISLRRGRRSKRRGIDKLRQREVEILEKFLTHVGTVTHIQSPNFGWADVIAGTVVGTGRPAIGATVLEPAVDALAEGRRTEPHVAGVGQMADTTPARPPDGLPA